MTEVSDPDDMVHVEWLSLGPRGAGWYWWIDLQTESTTDKDKVGPFDTKIKAEHDVFLIIQEADGR